MAPSHIDAGGASYSDHNVQLVSHRLEASDDAVAEQEFEVTERGLDHDEIAELVGYDTVAFVGQQGDNLDSTQDSGEARIGWGFNLDGEEFLLDESAETSASVTNGTEYYRDTDEQGQIFALQTYQTNSFSNTTDGAGGGPNGPTVVNESKDMADMLGTGPVLDVNDDLTSRVEIVTATTGLIAAGHVTRLYYDVDTIEGSRGRFGMPGD